MSTTSALAVGHRIRRLREAKGLSRNALARKIDVDVSSISGWESGKRLPRDTVRATLAKTLDCDLASLMSPIADIELPTSIEVLDVATEFPAVFAACARNLRHTLRATRIAMPNATPLDYQTEARHIIFERLLAGTLEVQRVEIFYTLERLKEVLSNILRYDGKHYFVKAHCIGMTEVLPFLGGYCFDETDVVFGGYWTGSPPRNYPVLHIRGREIQTFFMGYWREIWGRGTLLNMHGARDLSAVKDVAVRMGLPARNWRRFIEEARALETGDGAPPMI